MNLKVNIPKFLKARLMVLKLSLKELSLKSGIPYPTLKDLSSGNTASPELKTLIKIADFFQCSIDEVLGRDHKYFYNKNYIYYSLEINQIACNLKLFINIKRIEHQITMSRLSLNIGFNNKLISDFLKTEDHIKLLSTIAVLGMADYFDVSIDEMIGRISYDSKESDDISDNKNQDPQT